MAAGGCGDHNEKNSFFIPPSMLGKRLNSVIQILEEVCKYLLFFYFFSMKCNLNVKCIKGTDLGIGH